MNALNQVIIEGKLELYDEGWKDGMTKKESFEKEAEEWVKTKGIDAITCLKENIGWNELCEQAFKDGAEFGYNKAEKELVKAKEIVKKFSEFVNGEVELDPEYPEESQELTDLWNELCEQAEKFLKG